MTPRLPRSAAEPSARTFAIRPLTKARVYLAHQQLGPRYVACVEALQDLGSSDPVAVFGEIDVAKLRSSLTLFEAARPLPLFRAALQRWFEGERDAQTLELLEA